MRTNIVIDESLMSQAMQAGGFKTKKDAVEAGLQLIARQAAYREVRKWRGKLQWTDHDATWETQQTMPKSTALNLHAPVTPYGDIPAVSGRS